MKKSASVLLSVLIALLVALFILSVSISLQGNTEVPDTTSFEPLLRS